MDFVSLLISLTAIAINTVLTLIVYFRNPKSATNRVFAILGTTISLWLIAMYISLKPLSPSDSLMWIRLTIFMATPMSILFLLLAHTLPSDKLRLKRPYFISLIVATVIVMLITISPYAFTSIEYRTVLPSPQPGLGLIPFGLFVSGCSLTAVIILYIRLKRALGKEKNQLKWIMTGILIMYTLLILTVLLPVSIFGNNNFVILTPIYTLTFLGTTAYAIIKHRFLDIGLVVARAIAYSAIILMISIFYVSSTFFISTFFLTNFNPTRQLIVYTILTILVALSFQRLKQYVEKITDKFFFKGHYSSDQILTSLAHVMSTDIQLQSVSDKILQTLISEMRLTRGAFVLVEGGAIYDIIALGFEEKPHYIYHELRPLLEDLDILIFDDLEEGSVKQLMRSKGITIAKPLRVKDKNVGLLILGEKASGEIYSEQDIKLLEILSPEVSVAIQNSQSYDKIQKFNITLSVEIAKATQELKLANSRLQELDQLKDDFVSIASHELRTPMTAIRSYSWMAINRSDIPLSEKLKKYLTRTLTSTERLINLVNDMLNISRIESGRIEITPNPFDLKELVKEVFEEVSARAREKKLKLFLVDTKLPQVFADSDKVHQVLLNLVGNSLKFTPIDGSITISFFCDGQKIEILVKDTGVGISSEDLSGLFKKFGRLDNSYVAAATSGGTGLGLYISKSLVELMGGKISVSSEGPGKGTTFIFSLLVATPTVLAQSAKYTNKPKPGEAKQLEPVSI